MIVAHLLLSSALITAGFAWGSAGESSSTVEENVSALVIDYPLNQSVFPPDFAPPTFIWRDLNPESSSWVIDIRFPGKGARIRLETQARPLSVGEIDPRCIGETNELPTLTPEQRASRVWQPDQKTWELIKKHSRGRRAVISISGLSPEHAETTLSQGQVTIVTAKEPVVAPIFYRDVPLMPSTNEDGVIKPLAESAVPLIAWRLRDVGKLESRLLMEDLHTCGNCHSFSSDGKTLGMDLDGPHNDKGLYALVDVKPTTVIADRDVIRWSDYRGKLGGRFRTAFMAQVSPDGRFVVATINDPGTESRERLGDVMGKYFVTNFTDYRFLQVFYPTRGILAWYSQDTGRMMPLPGADDPRYVHTGAVWSPDGKYLVFARAEARDPFPPNAAKAEYANDPNEAQIQYDLYRIPFWEGRGGTAEPVLGASGNGMSNNFAKVSPDGRWIVFVQCRNGQLMRPDSLLHIVPFGGGRARRMNCNTPRMNSWHSFSPNGRWMVFSSKGLTPYTQMFLTYIDKEGNDTPPILIENATAANRAVNIPEFVNIAYDGLKKIETPAAEFYRLFNVASRYSREGQFDEAIREWRKALELSPEDAAALHQLGHALSSRGEYERAIEQFERVLQLDPENPDAGTSYGIVLGRLGRLDEAIARFEAVLRRFPERAGTHSNLGAALIEKGRISGAIWHCEAALSIDPGDTNARANLATALAMAGRSEEAIPHFSKALEADPDAAPIHRNYGFALLEAGQPEKAVVHLEKAFEADSGSPELVVFIARALVQTGKPGSAVIRLESTLAEYPGSGQIHLELAQVLASMGNLEEALPHFDRAVSLSGGRDPGALDALAAAYAETGRYPEALLAASRALEAAKQQGRWDLVPALDSKIDVYRSRATE